MNLLRSCRLARARHGWQPPRTASHVLEYIPPWQMDPQPEEGTWQLQTLENWLAGTVDGELGCMDNREDVAEWVLIGFVWDEFGEQVILDRFDVDIEGTLMPAYWVSPRES